MNFALPATVAIGALLAIPMMLQWERPPMDSKQQGYRGTGMVQIDNPRMAAKRNAAVELPEAQDPAELENTKASEAYENVTLLGELDKAQFDRLMFAITEWVSPEEGCTYCHNDENLADDSKYTKTVARRMLQMTKTINTDWSNHVAETGVTCFTCHRGQPVPQNVWSLDPGAKQAGGMAASRAGQNFAAPSVGLTSLPYDPFAGNLDTEGQIRVVAGTALPNGHLPNIKDTEKTYGLMMHLSDALGVNCTFCHNSRSFTSWKESSPVRVKAYHGLSMVRTVNKSYLEPLTDVFPAERKGKQGDVLKVNCATCHAGQSKPLGGAQMLKDYLAELNAAQSN